MSALFVSLVTLAFVFGGALLGMRFRNALPDDDINGEVRDVIKLSTGFIATMAALVLGLLTTSAKGTYDTKNAQVRQVAANAIFIDLELERYGSEAQNLRSMLREAIPPLIAQIWSEGHSTKLSAYSVTAKEREFIKALQQLQPDNDSKKTLQAQVLSTSAILAQARLSLFTESNDEIPTPFLVILVAWLTIIFTGFGLLVRPKWIVTVTFFVGSLSVASAIFLILEMGQPFAGVMQISSEVLRHALAPLGN